MGSICSINMRPFTWPAHLTEKRLKPEFGGEELQHIEYGTVSDDPDGTVGMTMLMRKSVYDKLLSGEYKISPDSSRLCRLIVIDRAGRPVQPMGSVIY